MFGAILMVLLVQAAVGLVFLNLVLPSCGTCGEDGPGRDLEKPH